MSSLPVLYHFPLSPYSARVRLALEEKGVRWESRTSNIVAMENYEPDYVRMHPGAVVPLLVDGARVGRHPPLRRRTLARATTPSE